MIENKVKMDVADILLKIEKSSISIPLLKEIKIFLSNTSQNRKIQDDPNNDIEAELINWLLKEYGKLDGALIGEEEQNHEAAFAFIETIKELFKVQDPLLPIKKLLQDPNFKNQNIALNSLAFINSAPARKLIYGEYSDRSLKDWNDIPVKERSKIRQIWIQAWGFINMTRVRKKKEAQKGTQEKSYFFDKFGSDTYKYCLKALLKNAKKFKEPIKRIDFYYKYLSFRIDEIQISFESDEYYSTNLKVKEVDSKIPLNVDEPEDISEVFKEKYGLSDDTEELVWYQTNSILINLFLWSLSDHLKLVETHLRNMGIRLTANFEMNLATHDQEYPISDKEIKLYEKEIVERVSKLFENKFTILKEFAKICFKSKQLQQWLIKEKKGFTH